MRIFAFLMVVAIFFLGCSENQIQQIGTEKPTELSDSAFTVTASGLKWAAINSGSGPHPQPGDRVQVNYSVWSTEGKLLDSSIPRKKVYEFTLGRGEVIQGWDEAVAIMKKGDLWQLLVPPQLAYGDKGIGGVIPPGATLIFEVELLDFSSGN